MAVLTLHVMVTVFCSLMTFRHFLHDMLILQLYVEFFSTSALSFQENQC